MIFLMLLYLTSSNLKMDKKIRLEVLERSIIIIFYVSPWTSFLWSKLISIMIY